MDTLVKGKLRESEPVEKQIPMILPENLLQHLFQELDLQIPDYAVDRYWKHAKEFNCPWSDASDGSHIPCALYGDSAKFSVAGEKITCVFFSLPLWNPRAARYRIWLLFSVETYTILSGGLTMFPLYQKVVESMLKLYHDGITVDGNTLKFVVTELKGDWEWHEFSLCLSRSWRNHQFCWRCDASKDESHGTSYLDFGEHPVWKPTTLSHVQFLARCIHSNLPAGACALGQISIVFLVLRSFCVVIFLLRFSQKLIECNIQGPLILLPKFHYTMIRHCSMRNINLGILGVANGSSLLLDSNQLQFQTFESNLLSATNTQIYKMFEASSSFVGLLW